MMIRVTCRRTILTAVLLCTIAVLGCNRSQGPRRAAVSGSVTLDGKPVPEGTITFLPSGDTQGPSAGGEIRDGAFDLNARQGPVVGTCRVEIRATRKTGEKVQFGVREADAVEQYIPQRYNTRSELTAAVIADEPNRLDFELTAR